MDFGPRRTTETLTPDTLSPEQQIAAIYTAVLGRMPDPAGLAFWVEQHEAATAAGRSAESVWGAIATSIAKGDPNGEAARQHAFLVDGASAAADSFVTALFTNLYNRPPAEAELTFWRGQFQTRFGSVGDVIVDLISGSADGPQGPDATVLTNKLTAALDYAAAFEAAGAAWTLAEDGPGATQVARLVGSDSESLDAAETTSQALAAPTQGISAAGAVTVDGIPVDSVASQTGALVVGADAGGTVAVTGGATLTASASSGAAVRVGAGESGRGFLLLSRSESQLSTEGGGNQITIGDGGRGTLLATGGASVVTGAAAVGQDGTGNLQLSGDGTEFAVSDAADGGAVLEIGAGGRVAVDDGAMLSLDATAAAARLLVSGEAGPEEAVAVDGGRLAVTQSGGAEAAAPEVLVEAGGSGMLVENGGRLDVMGPGARVIVEDDAGLTLRSGAQLLLSSPVPTAGSVLTVSGSDQDFGTSVSVTGEDTGITFAGAGPGLLVVGDAVATGATDAATLTIAEGAEVAGATNLVLGNAVGSNGELVVTGGAALDLAGVDPDGLGAFAEIGRRGTGRLEIDDGGTVTIDGTDGARPGLALGVTAIGSGDLTVSGEGSTLRVLGGPDEAADSARLLIGRGGEGSLRLADGGTVVNAASGITVVGRESTARGEVELAGEDSLLDAGARLVLGGDLDSASGAVRPDAGGEAILRQIEGAVQAGTPNDGESDIFIGATGEWTLNPDIFSGGESGGAVRGDVAVASGGAFQLGAEQTLTGDLVVADGAEFGPSGDRAPLSGSPLAGLGTVTIDGDWTHEGTAVFDVGGGARRSAEIGAGDPTAADQVVVTGQASLSGTIMVDFGNFEGDSFELVRATGGLDIADDLVVETTSPDRDPEIQVVGTANSLSIEIVGDG